MNRCILGEINDKTYILAKSPKVHKGGGWPTPPIGGYGKIPHFDEYLSEGWFNHQPVYVLQLQVVLLHSGLV